MPPIDAFVLLNTISIVVYLIMEMHYNRSQMPHKRSDV